MALLLIEKGADINAKDSMKRTPLFYALIIENKELVKVKNQISSFKIVYSLGIAEFEMLSLEWR